MIYYLTQIEKSITLFTQRQTNKKDILMLLEKIVREKLILLSNYNYLFTYFY